MGGRGASSGVSSVGKMTALQQEAVEWYVSGDGMWINQALRGRGDISMSDLTDGERTLLKGLDGATTQQVKQKTLYRSVDAEAVFGNITDTQYYNPVNHLVYGDNQKLVVNSVSGILSGAKGKTVIEKGFMSTTTSRSTAAQWGGFTGSSKPIVLQLNVKSKVKGRDLTKHKMAQDEVLLARNQKYKITGITAKDGNIYVTADI